MADIQYGRGAYRRDRGGLPEMRLVNMFVEATPSSDQGVTLQSRPGLASYASVGAGPVSGGFAQDGTFSGDSFSISGGALYRGTTLIGPIDGSGPISFAASATELLVAAGSQLWRYNGTTLAAVTFPDSANVTAIAFLKGYFLAARADSHKLYFSGVLNGNSWDALDFVSAESKPDTIRGVFKVRDEVWLAGGETVEFFAPTGDGDAPFQAIEARQYDKGMLAVGAGALADNTLFFVGSDGLVYRGGAIPDRVSDNGIEERIGQSASIACLGFVFEGHTFFGIRTDSGDYLFDAATKQWSNFETHGLGRWLARSAWMVGDTPYFGHYSDGTVLQFDGWLDDGDPLVRLFTAAAPINGGTAIIDNLRIWANVGRTEVISGAGTEPVVEMRSSDDAGVTWGPWDESPLGAQGQYREPAEWRRCGMFDFPGFISEVRCTENTDFRVSRVSVNEDGGGRG
jgi:hypothetical protein